MSYLARLQALNLETPTPSEAAKGTKEASEAFAASSPPCISEIATVDSAADRQAERAAIVQEGAKVPADWADGFARLEATPIPAGVNVTAWQAMMDAAGRFLDQWGAKAAALGWEAGELFSLDPQSPFGRLDHRGAAFLLARARVVALTSEAITVAIGGNIQRFLRRPGLTPAWNDAGLHPSDQGDQP